MVLIMRGAGVLRLLFDSDKHFKCDRCDGTAGPKHKSLVSALPLYAFNYEGVADVFFSHDMDESVFGRLSVLCNGITFQVVFFLWKDTACPGPRFGRPSVTFIGRDGPFTQMSWRATDRALRNRGVGISDEIGYKRSSCSPRSSRRSRARRPRRTTWKDFQRCDEESHQRTPSHRQRADEELCSGGN